MREALRPERYDDGWERAIAAIEQRFTERFLDPAEAILRLDANDPRVFPEGRGFALLALDCLLIESLFGYRRGARTRMRETTEAFTAFLTDESHIGDDPHLAERVASFVRAVRNGLLHDGETREGWIVWKSHPNGTLFERLADGRIVLYRDTFHGAVTKRLAAYFAELRASGLDAAELRERFKQRVDQLCKESNPAEAESRAMAWQAEALPRWSFDQLTQRDERTRHFTLSGLATGFALTEKGSWHYVQAMVSDFDLASTVPSEIRGRVEAVRLLHVYGYFQMDFFDLVHGEAALAAELALRVRFASQYPEKVRLLNAKSGQTVDFLATSYERVGEALRPRGPYPSRDGWRLQGFPDFDGSLRGLYLWARDLGLLKAFLDPVWERARPGIAMSVLMQTGDHRPPEVPGDFDRRTPEERELWWNGTYRPAWEVSYLENEVNLRNALAHPTGGLNRMPNYSARSVRQLFNLVNALFTAKADGA
jgi:hypothetical protein